MGGCACDKGFIGLGAIPRDPRSLRPLKTKQPRLTREMILNKQQPVEEKKKADTGAPIKLSRAILKSRHSKA